MNSMSDRRRPDHQPLISMATGEPLPKLQGEDALTHHRIARIALRLFAERGYSAVSVGEIVEACGLTKGALYWYYSSKEELFHKITSDSLQSWERRVMEAVGDATEWDVQLAAVFRVFIEVLESADDPHRDLLMLMTLRGAGGPGQHGLGFESLQRFSDWIDAVMATHPDEARRCGYAALVHTAGLGVLSEAAFGSNLARLVLSSILDVLGGRPLYPDVELSGQRAGADSLNATDTISAAAIRGTDHMSRHRE